jgi:hypothetical protein
MNVGAVGAPGTAIRARGIAAFTFLALVLASEASSRAQPFSGPTAPPSIKAPISEANFVRLPGNVRPEADAVNAPAIMRDTLPIEDTIAQLRRSQAASPNHHRWLTPEEFGARFGPAAARRCEHHQLAALAWISRQCNVLERYGTPFLGTPGQVPYHTEIHDIVSPGRSTSRIYAITLAGPPWLADPYRFFQCYRDTQCK